MTKILALDTATEACSAALLLDENQTSQYEVAPQAHTRKILPMCETLLQIAGIGLPQLDAIAFGRGPGSFTGVRIGIGVAQGLAFGAGVPLIGISNLAMLAQGAYRRHGVQRVFCAIDARMNEVYFGAFQLLDGVMQPLMDEEVLSPDEAAARCLILLGEYADVAWMASGTGFAAYDTLANALANKADFDDKNLPAAEDMLPLARAAWLAGNSISPELATPVYLRDKVTWKKLPGRE